MYMYDLHCHTKEGSTCSNFPAAEMAQYYKSQGYAGFCITDHFTGSTPVSEMATWEERVNKIWEVYDIANKEAEKLGIKCFPAMEFSLRQTSYSFAPCTGNDFVILGLTREWLLEHKWVFDLQFDDMYKEIHKAGGFVIHAHPFLEAWWVRRIVLYPRAVDAVECFNAHSTEENNQRASWYADQYNLPKTGGTDNHQPGRPLIAGVETEEPCDTIEQLIEAIRSGSAKPFLRNAK